MGKSPRRLLQIACPLLAPAARHFPRTSVTAIGVELPLRRPRTTGGKWDEPAAQRNSLERQLWVETGPSQCTLVLRRSTLPTGGWNRPTPDAGPRAASGSKTLEAALACTGNDRELTTRSGKFAHEGRRQQWRGYRTFSSYPLVPHIIREPAWPPEPRNPKPEPGRKQPFGIVQRVTGSMRGRPDVSPEWLRCQANRWT
jgi:hypothetical protein